MKLQELSLENRFLVNCLRIDFNDNSQYINSGIFSKLNWETVLKKAAAQQIAPLLFYTIQKALNHSLIPQSFKDTLEDIYQHTLSRNLFLYHILEKIIKSFRDKNISLIALRGPVLGENLYSNIALRPMQDLDILIKKEDRQTADEILHKLGYRTSIPFHIFQMIYINKDSQIPLDIELHWALDPKIEKDAQTLWGNTCTTRINDAEVPMLRPELLLIHLLTHLDKHITLGETRLIWFSDIYRLVRCYGKNMDWNFFLDKTEKNKLQKPVYEILSIIKEWFELSMPVYVTDRLKTVKCPYLEKDIFNPDPRHKQIIYISSLPKIQGIFNKIHYLLRIIFPAKRTMVKLYSQDKTAFSYLFYFYRLHKMSAIILNTILHKLKCVLRQRKPLW